MGRRFACYATFRSICTDSRVAFKLLLFHHVQALALIYPRSSLSNSNRYSLIRAVSCCHWHSFRPHAIKTQINDQLQGFDSSRTPSKRNARTSNKRIARVHRAVPCFCAFSEQDTPSNHERNRTDYPFSSSIAHGPSRAHLPCQTQRCAFHSTTAFQFDRCDLLR